LGKHKYIHKFEIVIIKLKKPTLLIFLLFFNIFLVCARAGGGVLLVLCGYITFVGVFQLWEKHFILMFIFLVVESQLTSLGKRCPFCFSRLITTCKVYYGTG